MAREAEIKFTVKLNEDKFPEEINWQATDAGFDGTKKAEAILLSVWDSEQKGTLSVDLWTNKMLIGDMGLHFYQTFLKMADTYQAASNNEEAANLIRKFSVEFAEKVGLNKE